MKLENINDVLKENMSKDCRIYYLASCILDCDEYSIFMKAVVTMMNLKKGS